MRSMIIRVTGHAGHSGSDASFLREGADAVWPKPFPSAFDGSMQQALLPLLNRRLACAAAHTPPSEGDTAVPHHMQPGEWGDWHKSPQVTPACISL